MCWIVLHMSLKLWLVLWMQRAKSTVINVYSIAILWNMFWIILNQFKMSFENLDVHWKGDTDIRRWLWCIGMSSPFKSWGFYYATWIMSWHVVNIFDKASRIYIFWVVKILVCWLRSLHFKRLRHMNSCSSFQINLMHQMSIAPIFLTSKIIIINKLGSNILDLKSTSIHDSCLDSIAT